MMTTITKPILVQDAVETVCQLMAVAAITAPKTKGEDFVEVLAVTGENLRSLGQAMIAYGEQSGKKNFDRDGSNVLKSDAVVLIGLKVSTTAGLNCGACGYDLCDELLGTPPSRGEFAGPFCAYRLLDMGIALGSAAKTAGLLNADSRIMYRIGVAARQTGLVDWEFVLGIPLSVTGKSIYFDR
jgi:uncharacterized ferredoxin-like protein